MLDELLRRELIDQVGFTPSAEYGFRHPLIRTVAYESQLKSDRAELHRRLAAAIEQRAPDSVEENAALIAEHLHAAGDLHAPPTHGTCAPRRGRPTAISRGPAQLGAGTPDRRPTPRRRHRPTVDADRPPHHALCHRFSSQRCHDAGVDSRS